MNFLACTRTAADGASTSGSCLIKDGDCVIVYEGVTSMKAAYISAKGRFESRFGVFKHQSWIGKPFGSKVTADAGGGGWVYLLRPTPELWTQVLRHRTQILYLADISMVVMQLDLRPGSVVLESGTGSGSLTHSLVRAVAPTGHVHTFEFHAGRVEDAAAEFKQHGLSGLVTVKQRNIEEQGFPETLHGGADAIFLDLPGPHKVVPSAAACLRPNGRFCAFSPCIEQVQRTAEALSAAGFTDIITYECLLREYEVHREVLATTIRLAEGPAPKRLRHNPAPAQPAADAQAPQAAAEGASAEAAEEGASGAGTDAAAAADGDKTEKAEAAGSGEAPAEQGGSAEQQQGQASKSGARGSESMRIVSFRPKMEARGHTGYLTFARKYVCG